MGNRRPVVLFNVPPSSLRGGSAVAAAKLYAALSEPAELITFSLGRKSDSETLTQKVRGRVVDLVQAYRLMRRVRPDVIHLNSTFDPRSISRDAIFVFLAKGLGIPVLIVFHGSADESFGKLAPPLEAAKQALLSHVACVGVQSEAERTLFIKTFPRLAQRVRVVKNIVDKRFLECIRQPEIQPRILFISRFIRAKGPFDLLEAIPRIVKVEPTARFTFAGDGDDLGEFRGRVEALGVEKFVDILDNVPNRETVELYRRAWMLVFPTWFPEGMPMVAAEALGCGLPLVTTRTRFAQSYLREGEHLLYIPHRDPEAIAARVVELIQRPDLRKSMGESNRHAAQLLFGQESVSSEFLQIYRELTLTARPTLSDAALTRGSN